VQIVAASDLARTHAQVDAEPVTQLTLQTMAGCRLRERSKRSSAG
jgi:hypothetical protein